MRPKASHCDGLGHFVALVFLLLSNLVFSRHQRYPPAGAEVHRSELNNHLELVLVTNDEGWRRIPLQVSKIFVEIQA